MYQTTTFREVIAQKRCAQIFFGLRYGAEALSRESIRYIGTSANSDVKKCGGMANHGEQRHHLANHLNETSTCDGAGSEKKFLFF
jgi:hypothetical protein